MNKCNTSHAVVVQYNGRKYITDVIDSFLFDNVGFPVYCIFLAIAFFNQREFSFTI